MSSSLLERLRAALAPQYEVERELGAGGMGTIFLARDVTLQCERAVKILRPELATATAAERFLREARILAKLSHANVVPVHSAGEVDGLFYYVMDRIEGDTLAERLERGTLSRDEAVKLGADLLNALEAAHEGGVIHRDVKPANIFLVGDRALLGDFGVAKPTGEDSPPLTAEGHQVGTPVYMAPEQIAGSATPQSDLYAAGMIIYEALTGRRWSIATAVDQADWSDVPSRLAPVLRRALALAPAERWEDAAAFREALTRPGPRVRTGPRKYAPIAAPLVIIAAVVAYVVTRPSGPGPEVWDLAILPVQMHGWDAPIDGADLAGMVTSEIVGTPGVSAVSPWLKISDWWESAMVADLGPLQTRAAAELGARKAVFATCTSWGEGDSVQVDLQLYDDRGDPFPALPPIIVSPARPQDVSKAIAHTLVRAELDTVVHPGQRWTDDFGALKEFLLGRDNFERGRGELARDHYRTSVARDSSFALAWWELANAWRWLGQRGPFPEQDFQQLFNDHAADLGVLDSMLMAVQLTPAGQARLNGYKTTQQRFPRNYFAAFLHGEELFNRGPLWGEPLERAVVELEQAVRLNPLWTLAYVHLIWANVRLGHEAEARRHLDGLLEHAPDPDQSWTSYPPELLGQAIAERFAPEEARQRRQGLLQDPEWGQPYRLVQLARIAGGFDVSHTQVELGLGLLSSGEAIERPHQAAAHLAAGLGRVGLGQIDQALDHFDAAAEIHDTPEARLLAAEWRVLARVVGLDVVEPAEVERGTGILESLVGEDSVGVRACWVLALHAFAVGDTTRARRLYSLVMTAPPESGAEPLGQFLYAVLLAQEGRYEDAIARSGTLLAVQTPTVLLHGAPSPGRLLSDPFARALLHIKRGDWYAALGQPEAAEQEYLWYEAVDVLGLPETELPQAGEIDWALGNWGRFLRGSISPDRERACVLLNHVLESWSDADPGFAEEVAQVQSAASQKCR
ncbi:MAG: serine/threonine-protein kinase [Gemmatimonadales bacterium]|jgi:tetratricopeptide (TPR) repeat protein/tRNA A-37 threonylcarbamoyl transferase component Bud32